MLRQPIGMEITQLIDARREIAVYDDIDRARAARADLLATGYRPQEVSILDRDAAVLTRLFEGPPIPEAIAGAIFGAFLSSTLTFHPALAPLLDPFGPTFMPIIAIGAALGAIASYLIAEGCRPAIVRRELGEGEYVVVVPVTPRHRERVHRVIEQHHPRALDEAA